VKERPESAVTSVLGTILMLSLLAMMLPGALMLKASVEDEMAAQRDAAEHAAYCARNPGIGPPACPAPGPMPGYACTQVASTRSWVCAPQDASTNVTAPNATLDASL